VLSKMAKEWWGLKTRKTKRKASKGEVGHELGEFKGLKRGCSNSRGVKLILFLVERRGVHGTLRRRSGGVERERRGIYLAISA